MNKIAQREKDIERAAYKLQRLAEILKDHGTKQGLTHNRIVFPKDILDHEDLGHLGFKSTLTAIPEAGEDRNIGSLRGPGGLHVHSHGDEWTMHRDAHTGVKHGLSEGWPALLLYMKNRDSSYADKVRTGMSREALKKIEDLRS